MGGENPALVVGPLFLLFLCGGGVGMGIGAWFVAKDSLPIAAGMVAVGAVLVGGGAFMGYHMFQTFDWVEFDGHTLRACHLYTRTLLVHPVSDVTGVKPYYINRKNLGVTGAAVKAIIGPVLGYEIMLAGRRRGVWMAVGDTRGARELAEAVAKAAGRPIAPPRAA